MTIIKQKRVHSWKCIRHRMIDEDACIGAQGIYVYTCNTDACIGAQGIYVYTCNSDACIGAQGIYVYMQLGRMHWSASHIRIHATLSTRLYGTKGFYLNTTRFRIFLPLLYYPFQDNDSIIQLGRILNAVP